MTLPGFKQFEIGHLKTHKHPLALVFTLDYDLHIPFRSVYFCSPVQNVMFWVYANAFQLQNESIYGALKGLRIREDLNMCKCTVSCILYHVNANIEKKYKCSHTSWFTAQQVFSCLR